MSTKKWQPSFEDILKWVMEGTPGRATQPVRFVTTDSEERPLSELYPIYREQYFTAIVQESEGRFDREDISAFCLAIQTQIARKAKAAGMNPEDSPCLYGLSPERRIERPLKLSLRQAVKDGYGITGRSASALKHRETLVAVAYALQTTAIEILNSEGTGRWNYLCTITEWHMKKYTTTALSLCVHRVFADLSGEYGTILRDTTTTDIFNKL